MSDVAVRQETNKIVPLNAGGRIAGIVPQTIEEVFRIATAIAKSGLAPRGMETAEKLTVAIMHGLEIGLPPMQSVQRIAVVNGRPTVWGDAVPALLLARGFRLREWMEGETAHCEVTRPDGTKTSSTFSPADARKAGLWGKVGPWQQYPNRMLQMRARGFACRDGAADALAGLYIAEEVEGGDLTAAAETLPKRKSAAESKRDGTADTFNEIKADIATATSIEMLDHIIETHRDTLDSMPRSWAQLVNDEYDLKAKEFAPDAPTEAA